MKKIKLNSINRISATVLFFIGCLSFFTSCEKDSGVSGPPMVTGVRLLDPSKKDSTFTSALPGTMILVEGQNLGGITHVYFNGQDTWFNPVYNTNTNLIITISGDAPTEATDPNVPNQIRIVTNHGETTYDFILTIPPPVISNISNENALAGDSVIIYGSNLWLIEKVIFPGGKEVTEVNSTIEGSRLGLVMPDIGDDTGRIIIQAKYGTTMANAPMNDHQSGDVISNLTASWETGEQSVFNWSWWGANRTTDEAMYPGTRGAYLQNNFDAGASDNGWWNGNRSGNFDAVQLFTPDVLTQPASNYALKFEINTRVPWTTGVDVLRFGETYAYRYMPWSLSVDNIFDTKHQWQTVTIPLSEFKKAENGVEGTGANAATMGDLVTSEGKVAFTYRFITEADPVTGFDAAFDNFRIVKIR